MAESSAINYGVNVGNSYLLLGSKGLNLSSKGLD